MNGRKTKYMNIEQMKDIKWIKSEQMKDVK